MITTWRKKEVGVENSSVKVVLSSKMKWQGSELLAVKSRNYDLNIRGERFKALG